MSNRKNIVLVFGGRSSEHSISCATASGIMSAIDRNKFRVIPVGLTRDGVWVLAEDDAEKYALNSDFLPEVLDNRSRIIWPDRAGSRELSVQDESGAVHSLGEVDLIFPILHGKYGEDGSIQGFFELYDLPYLGSGILASAIAQDKHFTKAFLKAAGVPVAEGITVFETSYRANPAAVKAKISELPYPLFIKPARSGSSVGVSKVKTPAEVEAALEKAFAEDKTALVEVAVIGREIECAVLAGRQGKPPRVAEIGEIVIEGPEFYDFEAKYLDSPGVELHCPAQLSPEQSDQAKELAARVFELLQLDTLARVDLFLTDNGLVLNEVNTLPGFTPISMFPKCWQVSGLEYPSLITELIELSLDIRR